MNTTLLRTAILVSLADGPHHGYGVLQEVIGLTDGQIKPAVGSLYRIIDLLVRDGFVAEHSSEVVDGRFRRYYQLTPAGRTELAESTATMASVVDRAKERLARPMAAPIAGEGA